VVVE
jgi:hypothetical protein